MWKMVSTDNIRQHIHLDTEDLVDIWKPIQYIDQKTGMLQNDDGEDSSQDQTEPLIDTLEFKKTLLLFLFKKGLVSSEHAMMEDEKIKRSNVINILKKQIGDFAYGNIVTLEDLKFVKTTELTTMYVLDQITLPTLASKDTFDDMENMETVEESIDYILAKAVTTRTVVLMPVEYREEELRTSIWRDRFFKDIFGARAIVLKANKTAGSNQYNNILHSVLQKQKNNKLTELDKLQTDFDTFKKGMFTVDGMNIPNDKVKQYLESGVDRAYEDFFRLFEKEVQRRVEERVGNNEKLLMFVCQYVLAHYRKQKRNQIRMDQGKGLQINTEKPGTTEKLATTDFDANSQEEWNEIMTQKSFDSYVHTDFLHQVDMFEQRVVNFLNRMRLQSLIKKTQSELNEIKK